MLIKSPIEAKISKSGESYTLQAIDRFFCINDDKLYLFKTELELKKRLKWEEITPESKRNIREYFLLNEKQQWAFFFIEEKVYFMNIQLKKSKAYISELLQTRYTFKTENVIK